MNLINKIFGYKLKIITVVNRYSEMDILLSKHKFIFNHKLHNDYIIMLLKSKNYLIGSIKTIRSKKIKPPSLYNYKEIFK